MYYEINVSKDGVHYFATAPRSITDEGKFKKLIKHFDTLFLAEDGYKISASYYPESGRIIDVEEVLR